MTNIPTKSISKVILERLEIHKELLDLKLGLKKQELENSERFAKSDFLDKGKVVPNNIQCDAIDLRIEVISLENEIQAKSDYIDSYKYKINIDEARYSELEQEYEEHGKDVLSKYLDVKRKLNKNGVGYRVLEHLYNELHDAKYRESKLDAFNGLNGHLKKL